MNLPTTLLPQQVLQWHTQTSQNSCAASGMEIILKSHGLIPVDDLSIQLKYGNRNIGFEQKHELESRDLRVSTTSKTVPDLLALLESETQQGRFPLVSLPVRVDQNGIWFHIFVGQQSNGLILLLDPATGFQMSGEKANLSTALGYLLRASGLPMAYQLDCLTYQIGNKE